MHTGVFFSSKFVQTPDCSVAVRSGFSSGEAGGALCERVSVSQLEGSGGMLPRENLKLKSSEMARNGSKTAKSEVNF